MTYCVWEGIGEAPQGLTSLLGVCGGIWFGAMAGDRKKRADEVGSTADRAETKVDKLTDVAERQHPGSTKGIRDD